MGEKGKKSIVGMLVCGIILFIVARTFVGCSDVGSIEEVVERTEALEQVYNQDDEDEDEAEVYGIMTKLEGMEDIEDGFYKVLRLTKVDSDFVTELKVLLEKDGERYLVPINYRDGFHSDEFYDFWDSIAYGDTIVVDDGQYRVHYTGGFGSE